MVYSKKILNIAKEKNTGDWRSWLARLTGSQKVTGSNPVFSTLILINLKSEVYKM